MAVIITVIVEKMGFEPTTFALPARRSSQLSYIPMMFKNLKKPPQWVAFCGQRGIRTPDPLLVRQML